MPDIDHNNEEPPVLISGAVYLLDESSKPALEALRQELLDALHPSVVNTHEEVLEYYSMRATQLIQFGWSIDINFVESYDWGAAVRFLDSDSSPHYSVYVFAEHMGNQHMAEWFSDFPERSYVTSETCSEMRGYLDYKKQPYVLAPRDKSAEYAAISAYYSNRTAARSQVRLMNHIDESLFILEQLEVFSGSDARELAKRAFCLHPILQVEPERLEEFRIHVGGGLGEQAISYAMKYSQVANDYLAHHSYRADILPHDTSDIVKAMLIADKVQNRKDFELYHQNTHSDSERLAEYFNEWLVALGVSEELYQKLVSDISERTVFNFV